MTPPSFSTFLSFVVVCFRRLWSLSHLAAMALYCSLAWFLVGLEPTTIFRTDAVCEQYNFLLQTFGLLTCVLALVGHWKDELRPDRRDVLRLRLGNTGVVVGLFFSYWCFWVCACVLPMMLAAAMQQLLAGGFQYIDGSIFLNYLCASAFTGFTPLWLACGLVIFTIRRNEPLTVFVLLLVVASAAVLKQVSGGFLFDNLWLEHPSLWSVLMWVISLGSIAIIIFWFQRRMETLSLDDTMARGLTMRLFALLRWDMSAFHARLLNMSHALVLAFFSALGLVIIIPLVRQSPSFVQMANIYFGAFVPLLFGLYVGSVIEVDIKADLAETMRVRSRSYWQIVLNRWCVMLLPMAITIIGLGATLWALTPHYAIGRVMYCVILGVVWQAVALALSLMVRSSGAWQIVLSLVVYVQLRDDVQHVMNTSLFSVLNVVAPLFDTSQAAVSMDYLKLGAYAAIAMGMSIYRLRA
jgi:hypothetical protein